MGHKTVHRDSSFGPFETETAYGNLGGMSMKKCSTCGSFKTPESFVVRKQSKDGLSASCRECKKLRDSACYQKFRKDRIGKVRQRTLKNQAVLGDIKTQNGCHRCGLKDNRSWLFDFDHLGDKQNLVSRMIGHKLDAVLDEASKCQVLCSNCHRAVTYQRRNGTSDPVASKKALQIPVVMKNWQAMLEFKARPCLDCGLTFHFAAMDCDHRDPKTKTGDPATLFRNGAHEAFMAELEKCDPVCSNCHRIRENARAKDTSQLSVRELAQLRMVQTPGLSYQRAIREVIAEREPFKNPPRTMAGAYVTKISNERAAGVILKYEWLGTMGRPQACYGLWFVLEGVPTLAGAVCFGLTTGNQANNVCGPTNAHLAIALERGACVHWAPKNAASWFVPKAIAMASKDYGWRIFYAYSDPEANEIGTIYQACNWLYLGAGPGHGPTRQRWTTPEGKRVSSRALRYHKLKSKEALALGWTKEVVRSRGKYVWFEGSARYKTKMRKLLVHPVAEYPKR